MSGICGICQPGRTADPARVTGMLAGMTFSGELGSEHFGAGPIAMGVARRWPFQQIASIPGVHIAVDAEIFNKKELSALVDPGVLKSSQLSTAEILAALYVQKGIDFIQCLDGVFSIAIWDEKKRRLILAIDRLGVNSLYWRQEPERLLFASRVGGIRAELDGAADVNAPALMQYLLFSVVPAPMSIYRGVEKLRPGHVLIFEGNEVHQKQYWDMEFPEEEGRDEEYWAGEVQREIRKATQSQLHDCVPAETGAFLSGGTDSSSVVAFLSEWNSPANSFSIFFSEDRYNEIEYAHIAAKQFGTRHHELCLKPQDALDALPLLTHYFDEPFANSSAIGGYFCADLARKNGVNTLLAGDGGDELFAGNERYSSDKRFALYHSIPPVLRKWLIEPMAQIFPESDSKLSLPRRYIRRALIPNPQRIFSYGLFLSTPPEEIFEPGFLETAPPEHWLDIAKGHFEASNSRGELNRLLYLDIKMTLADNDLRKVLGTAELAGVRARFPLLDYRLAELSGRIPAHLKLKGFRKRYIFKKAMKNILPQEILKKKKHGFGVPVALWFLQDPRLEMLVKDTLNDARTRQRGYFQPSFFDKVIRRHREEDAKNYGEIIWYLVVLELWHRQHLETRTGSTNVR
jgi:asparagine synthase (glutamine-hydrolysing)